VVKASAKTVIVMMMLDKVTRNRIMEWLMAFSFSSEMKVTDAAFQHEVKASRSDTIAPLRRIEFE